MEMDIKSILSNENSGIVIFLLAALIAFISWLVKGLIEKPLSESKKTFNNLLEKRIEILTEVRSRLTFIAYFPTEDSLEYKNQLQEIILNSGKTAYLNGNILDSAIRIAIDPKTNESLLLDTICKIDTELRLQIGKIEDEISFYIKFSNYNPLKRFVGLTLLSLQYIFSLLLVIFALLFLIWIFLSKCIILKILAIIIAVTGLYLINKWLKNK